MNFTPRETVSELDRYIIGQNKAKRAVAIALRNRWRRQQVEGDLRDEISPKNIIMIGPTGCGKTEIARRLAKLAKAPFVKVEASKFTEVGYVGRDVESMIRDLVEMAIQLVQDEAVEDVRVRAQGHAEDRLVKLIAAKLKGPEAPQKTPQTGGLFAPFMNQKGGVNFTEAELAEVRADLRAGKHDDITLELDVQESGNPFMTVFGQNGMEEMNLNDMLQQIPGFKGRTKTRRVNIEEAKKILEDQEAKKLVDMDSVQRRAIERTEQSGIVFLDEIDKVVGRSHEKSGPDVSREGVQRDLLPIVEGSTVSTKYGPVRTDHILFIAAGAFHLSNVSDMIPEMQGRFPIRVELESLKREDFVRILSEPKNAITKQYEALMKTEGVTLEFAESGIAELARYAEEANERAENIGARRLHTVMEALLEELSYSASEKSGQAVTVDGTFVKDTLEPVLSDSNLARYIL